jgi:hypothetical protein
VIQDYLTRVRQLTASTPPGRHVMIATLPASRGRQRQATIPLPWSQSPSISSFSGFQQQGRRVRIRAHSPGPCTNSGSESSGAAWHDHHGFCPLNTRLDVASLNLGVHSGFSGTRRRTPSILHHIIPFLFTVVKGSLPPPRSSAIARTLSSIKGVHGRV